MIKSLQSIGDELGISVSTVSRAISGHPGVSEKTRSRVLELAGKYGYAPDQAASSLRTGKGNGLTIIVPLKRPEIAVYRDDLLLAAGRKSFGSVKIVTLNPDESASSAILSAMNSKTGAIICSYMHEEIPSELLELLKSRRIPLTMIDSDSEGTDNIQIDRAAGTMQMARMLLLTGCRNPLFLSSCGLENPDNRLQGIIKAYKSLGMELQADQLVRFNNLSSQLETGFEAAGNILKTRYTDGLFCYSDLVAIGVMRAFSQAGIRIPAEIRIVGFDNIPLAGFLPVSLTTVAQPIEELVEKAIAITENRLKEFDAPANTVTFKTNLVIRESAPVTEHSLRCEIFKETTL